MTQAFNLSQFANKVNTSGQADLTTAVSGLLPIANGGTGTASPSLVAGTNVTISGTFPNQTINASSSSSYVGGRGQAFTANGTFTIPTGVTALKVTVIGGGSGGSNYAGNGGGNAIKWLTGLTAGNTLAVTIGSGGAGAITANTGGNGGNTTVASGTQTITTITGGGGQGANTSGTTTGGTATNGDINIVGGKGGRGGTAGGSLLGFGGSVTNVTGTNGTGYGAGGGAATSAGCTCYLGGNGTAGIVTFEW